MLEASPRPIPWVPAAPRGVPRAVHTATTRAVPPDGPDDRLPAARHVIPAGRGPRLAFQASLREDRNHAGGELFSLMVEPRLST